MARPISKTTKFILALPPTLSAKEVLAKAKASGHKTSEGNIYRVRRLHGGKKATAKSAAAPKATASGTGTKALNKSDYVRGFSRSTAAKDVVAKAKAAGIKLDIQYVYKLRSRSKSKPKKVAVAKPASVNTAKTKTNGFHSNAEDLLRAVAAELGLGHAVNILQTQRAQVRAVLGG
jgi:hypothetical protein